MVPRANPGLVLYVLAGWIALYILVFLLFGMGNNY
jgi:hypothetical protein